MTGEVRVLETNVKIFSTESEYGYDQKNSIEETSNETKLDEATKKSDIGSRFGRLRKSLRRRSGSIL